MPRKKISSGAILRVLDQFDPEGSGYDMDRARSVGMGPAKDGPNKGHFGSVAPTTESEQKALGLPRDSYVILKGKAHPTFGKAVGGEEARGFKVIKKGNRYFSVPR